MGKDVKQDLKHEALKILCLEEMWKATGKSLKMTFSVKTALKSFFSYLSILYADNTSETIGTYE